MELCRDDRRLDALQRDYDPIIEGQHLIEIGSAPVFQVIHVRTDGLCRVDLFASRQHFPGIPGKLDACARRVGGDPAGAPRESNREQ